MTDELRRKVMDAVANSAFTNMAVDPCVRATFDALGKAEREADQAELRAEVEQRDQIIATMKSVAFRDKLFVEEAQNRLCLCIAERDELRAEVERLKAERTAGEVQIKLMWGAQDALQAKVDAMQAAIAGTANWLDGIAEIDLTDIVADGGITAGMVVQQEAREHSRRLREHLPKPAPDPKPGEVWEYKGARYSVITVIKNARIQFEGEWCPIVVYVCEPQNVLTFYGLTFYRSLPEFLAKFSKVTFEGEA